MCGWSPVIYILYVYIYMVIYFAGANGFSTANPFDDSYTVCFYKRPLCIHKLYRVNENQRVSLTFMRKKFKFAWVCMKVGR